jgi:hypothetical protein
LDRPADAEADADDAAASSMVPETLAPALSRPCPQELASLSDLIKNKFAGWFWWGGRGEVKQTKVKQLRGLPLADGQHNLVAPQAGVCDVVQINARSLVNGAMALWDQKSVIFSNSV